MPAPQRGQALRVCVGVCVCGGGGVLPTAQENEHFRVGGGAGVEWA